MSWLAFSIVLASGLAWTALDALRKHLARELSALVLLGLLTGGMVPFYAGWLCLETPASQLPAMLAAYAAPGVAVLGLNLSANLLFIAAVRRSPLSLTIPFLSFTPVFMTLFAVPMLGEWPGRGPMLGIAFVVAGALVLSSEAGFGFIRGLWRERGCLYMLIVSLLWALNGPLEKIAVERTSLAFHLTVHCSAFTAVLLGVLVARGQGGQLRVSRPQLKLLCVASLCSVIAVGLQITAYAYTLVGLVDAIKRAVGLLGAVLIGRFAFGESVTSRKIAATALMGAGVAAILI